MHPAHLFGSALLFNVTILSTLHNYSGLHVYSFCKILCRPAQLFRSARLFRWLFFAALHNYWGLHAYFSSGFCPPARLLGSTRQLGHKEYIFAKISVCYKPYCVYIFAKKKLSKQGCVTVAEVPQRRQKIQSKTKQSNRRKTRQPKKGCVARRSSEVPQSQRYCRSKTI